MRSSSSTTRATKSSHGCLASIERACGSVSVVVVDHESRRDAADLLSERFPDIQLQRVERQRRLRRRRQRRRPRHVVPVPPAAQSRLRRSSPRRVAAWRIGWRAIPTSRVAGPRIRNADGTVQPSARRFPDFTTAIAGRSSWLTRVLPGNPHLAAQPSRARSGRRRHRSRSTGCRAPACASGERRSTRSVGSTRGSSSTGKTPTSAVGCKHAGWRTMYVPDGRRGARRRAQQPACGRRVARGVPPQRLPPLSQARRPRRPSCSRRSCTPACACGWRS